MLLKEVLSLEPMEGNRPNRDEYAWHRELTSNKPTQGQQPENWGLFVGTKLVRSGLTKAAAVALQQRPDLVKKYGRLSIQPINSSLR